MMEIAVLLKHAQTSKEAMDVALEAMDLEQAQLLADDISTQVQDFLQSQTLSPENLTSYQALLDLIDEMSLNSQEVQKKLGEQLTQLQRSKKAISSYEKHNY